MLTVSRTVGRSYQVRKTEDCLPSCRRRSAPLVDLRFWCNSIRNENYDWYLPTMTGFFPFSPDGAAFERAR